MKVRALISFSNAEYAAQPGEVYDVPPKFASKIIEAGYAEPAEFETASDSAPVETR